jgi:hypothetical protein
MIDDLPHFMILDRDLDALTRMAYYMRIELRWLMAGSYREHSDKIHAFPYPLLLFVNAGALKPEDGYHRRFDGDLRALIRRPDLGHVLYTWDDVLDDCPKLEGEIFFNIWRARPFLPTRECFERYLGQFQTYLRKMNIH